MSNKKLSKFWYPSIYTLASALACLASGSCRGSFPIPAGKFVLGMGMPLFSVTPRRNCLSTPLEISRKATLAYPLRQGATAKPAAEIII